MIIMSFFNISKISRYFIHITRTYTSTKNSYSKCSNFFMKHYAHVRVKLKWEIHNETE